MIPNLPLSTTIADHLAGNPLATVETGTYVALDSGLCLHTTVSIYTHVYNWETKQVEPRV